MATKITDDCINCGACEPECPNTAIKQGDPIYVIDPLLCTECVGFHDYEACAAVCPVDCCVTDSNNVESEEVLIARARALHPETNFGENLPSRFRKGQAAPTPAAAAPPPASAQSSAKPEAVEAQPAPPPKPAVTPAAPKVAASPEPAATAVSLPAAQSSAAPAPARAAPQPAPAKAAPQPKKEVRPKKTFEKELPTSFQEIAAQFKSGGALKQGFGRAIILLTQPVLGALPHNMKKQLEEAAQSPLFTAAGSTALNIIHNGILYPLVCMAVAVFLHGPAVIFSEEINFYVLVGILLAAAEGVFRLRDGIFHVKPAAEISFPAAVYGVPLSLVLQSLLQRHAGMIREQPIPVDGFYSTGFVEKLERERRYGNVYTIEDRGGALLLRMEFPRRIPDIGLAARTNLPDEIPDYDYDLALINGQFIVRGKCTDEQVRKISSSVGAFPPEFTTVIPLCDRVVGFAHKFENKLLEVFLLKEGGNRRLASHQ